ncbi:Na+-transporting NADH:ubiquinone oxidoreductase subunit A [Catalinimonas alkaloidigena]|uniref:Na(+)-translocating NADH-quinone reductase subunit A n=1 Tax=Catalinimonas alkaloidigena TaxID=1075417 RepID=A0A1G9GNA8_9BACT|nr:Na(+)-translocating NADH-quinone reductase subunit A [Catalinimonas alkaloidigena]SDL02102.1 Na+-transporting NADH:ubiquinone oxidoreductase subunit A [Catalinimonas alkaloidigena]
MSKTIKLKRGLDLNLAGKAEKKIVDSTPSELYAVKPSDFQGIGRQKLLVQEGDNVKAGTPLFRSKTMDRVNITSPVSGEVVEVKRGEKRRLLEIHVLADKQIEYESFQKYTPSDLINLSREEAEEQMLASGVWPHIIQRPFGVVANPADTPQAIFMSGFDSSPLAPDFGFAYRGEEKYLQAGIQVLKKFTSGIFHVNLNADAEVSSLFSQLEGVQVNKFSGPHPAGNVGVQIHHLAPIHKSDLVWTITPVGAIQIGKLFLEGKYDASKVVAVAGSEVKQPQYYRVLNGMRIDKLTQGNVHSDNVRFISGNVLNGERIAGNGFLGFYHSMLTIIPEGNHHRFLGWITPIKEKYSFQRAFGLLSYFNPKTKEYVMDTNVNGEERAFVQTGLMEKVLPMDVYVEYLLKAIMAQDYDNMEALGIYEIVEEDLALCEYIDVSKMEVQAIVREGIELMRNS